MDTIGDLASEKYNHPCDARELGLSDESLASKLGNLHQIAYHACGAGILRVTALGPASGQCSILSNNFEHDSAS